MADHTERIAELIRQGNKIEAIKLLRESTGIGLAEAKEQIEHLMAGTVPKMAPNPTLESDALSPDVLALLRAGKKIAAIKLYRERSGLSLKEAKERIDAVELDPQVATGQQSRLRLALIVVAVIILIGALVQLL